MESELMMVGADDNGVKGEELPFMNGSDKRAKGKNGEGKGRRKVKAVIVYTYSGAAILDLQATNVKRPEADASGLFVLNGKLTKGSA